MRTSHPLCILSAIALIGLLTSCGPEKLDRGKAANLIKEFYGYPDVELAAPDLYSISKRLEQEGYGRRYSYYTMLKFAFHEGAMMYLKNPSSDGYTIDGTSSRMGMGVKVHVISNCRDFAEVTGIAVDESTKTAKVEFTCRRLGPTPFGEFLGHKDGDILNYSVNMKLYDDGWRITDKQVENIKPETYPYFNSKGEFIGLPDEGV